MTVATASGTSAGTASAPDIVDTATVSTAVLAATGVSVVRGRRWLLRDVTLEAWAGRMLAVGGGPGAGKSTLLSVLGGLLAPTFGEVRYAGRRVRAGSAEHRRRTAMVLQGY
ncbi:MAG TPA: ATP-binding cassette domain-containing protein, partial [Actinopolymorphaceae bacterium]